MIIPIRCYTCNKLIADKWDNPDKTGYLNLLQSGQTIEQALNTLGLTRYCCRRMIMGHIDLVNLTIKYY